MAHAIGDQLARAPLQGLQQFDEPLFGGVRGEFHPDAYGSDDAGSGTVDGVAHAVAATSMTTQAIPTR